MCGIAAITKIKNPVVIRKMVDAMHHRGPDDNGTWSGDITHMGMARLAILDLSPAGHQPMLSEDGRYVLVFNGEIYNFQELRRSFLANEHLPSDGDTIVLLHLFQKMGIACVEHLRGMFAFIVWDNQEKVLWGARDRMGIKPLLYHRHGERLIIASEVKSILASGLVPFEVDTNALRQYFLYGSAQLPLTFVKDVLSLPPGSWFSLKGRQFEINTYWKFPDQVDESMSKEKAIDAFKETFDEAIRLRLISDRTVGIFLSSGLDSASLLASQVGKEHHIRTFTVGFDTLHQKYFSEVEQAAKLSAYFGYANDSIRISALDATKNIDEFIHGLDQPSIDGLNTFLVSKYSKDYLTVALSGLGGDELMLGYPRNINLFNMLQRSFHLPRNISEGYLKAKASRKSGQDYFLDALVNRAGGRANLKLLYWSNRLINKPWQVNQMMQQNKLVEEDLMRFYAFDDVEGFKGNTFNAISYFEIRSYMVSQLLRDMDAVSMSQSIEVRFPFTDHKLVELLFTMPWQYKYKPQDNKVNHRSGQTTYAGSGIKALLQDAYKDVLPPGYLNSPKQGFQLPIHQWMMEYLREDIESTYLSMAYSQLPISEKFIQDCLDNLRKGIFDKNEHLLYIFGKWHAMIKALLVKPIKMESVQL